MSSQAPADPGAAPPGGPAGSRDGNGVAPPPPVRSNLPVRTAPIVGRKTEMQAIAKAFEAAQAAGRTGRVEIVGRPGLGTTTVACELARRAGARMPGGSWYLDATIGADLAWAEIAALRNRCRVTDLRAAAREEKERISTGPRAIVVIDHVGNAAELLEISPIEGRNAPFTFIVCTEPTGLTPDVVHVADVPPHGARRMSQAMVRGTQDEGSEATPPQVPPVRVQDGLGLTTSIAARASLAWQGKHGPMLVESASGALQRFVPLLASRPATLELLLMASVLRSARIPVDVLFSAVSAVRAGRGETPKPEEIGQAILMLAQAGLVQPDDDRRISVHPLVQATVRAMAQSETDLEVARECAVTGLVAQADESVHDDGVDLAVCGLHQIRGLEADVSGESKDKVTAARTKIERALGLIA